MMDPDRIAAATMTWIRNPAEEALLGRALAHLARADIPVAVADRSRSAPFTSRLESFPTFRVTVPEAPGLVPQVQAALDLAGSFGRPFIFYTEPDKEFFFEHRLSDFLRRAPEAHDVGVVLAARSEGSYATFPAMQQYTEGVINHLCGQMIGYAGDYSYGPFLINRALLPHVRTLDPHLGWGWRHATFLAAHRRGFRVVHVTDEYPCPPDQRVEDDGERMHRLRQLSQNLLGLIHRPV